MTLLVTGGAGFIGSALVRHLITNTPHQVMNLDKLTYAGNLESLAPVSESPRYFFEQVDICDAAEVTRCFDRYQPHAVLHLAAESHVDRSIDAPAAFIQTNITGTGTLLEAARRHLQTLDDPVRESFLFLHVSTDEVFGDLADTGGFFTEQTPYAPSSPYSASKAAGDHLVRAWHRTYGLPVLITHVPDRPGHDLRYAIDAAKIQDDLGWTPEETFDTGIRKTVIWYLQNLDWCRRVQDGTYQDRQRLGLSETT